MTVGVKEQGTQKNIRIKEEESYRKLKKYERHLTYTARVTKPRRAELFGSLAYAQSQS
jgi:hypothetical protein